MKTKTILSLDLANSCGYAVYKNDKVVEYGVWNLKQHERNKDAKPHARLYDLLTAIQEKHDINYIVVEDAYIPDDFSKCHIYKDAYTHLLRLHGVLAMFCEDTETPLRLINSICVKHFMFSYSRNMPRETRKKLMVKAVQNLGYELPQYHADDVADAIGVLLYSLGTQIRAV